MSSLTHNESGIRQEICAAGSSLYDRGYAVGTAGNISARLDDGWVITPTDACLGRLEPDRLTKIDLDGQRVSGDKPSKTFSLHRAVYDRNPQVGAVVHTHSTHLVALTLAGVWRAEDVLPPITPYYVMKVGHIPLIEYHRPGDPAVARRVEAVVASVRGVLLERLGPMVWHESVWQAAGVLEELEETARLWMMLRDKPSPLTDEAIEELRRTFGARW